MSITAGADLLGHLLVDRHTGAGLLGDLVAVLPGNLATAFTGNLVAVLLGNLVAVLLRHLVAVLPWDLVTRLFSISRV